MIESLFIAHVDDRSMTQQRMRVEKSSTQVLVIEKTVKRDEAIIAGIVRLAASSPEAYTSVLDMVEMTPEGQDLAVMNLLKIARKNPSAAEKILPLIFEMIDSKVGAGTGESGPAQGGKSKHWFDKHRENHPHTKTPQSKAKKKHRLHHQWSDFMRQHYHSGKRKVWNTHSKTRKRYPKVTVNTLMKTDLHFRHHVQKQFHRWLGKGHSKSEAARTKDHQKRLKDNSHEKDGVLLNPRVSKDHIFHSMKFHPNRFGHVRIVFQDGTHMNDISDWMESRGHKGPMSKQILADLTGFSAIPGVREIYIWFNKEGEEVYLEVHGNNIKTMRIVVEAHHGVLRVFNEIISLRTENEGIPKNTYIKVLAQQVMAGLGHVRTIEMEPTHHDHHLLTWGELGFDGKIKASKELSDKIDDDQEPLLMSELLMAAVNDPSIKDLWKKEGSSWNGIFSLASGSRSLNVLHSFMEKQANKIGKSKNHWLHGR